MNKVVVCGVNTIEGILAGGPDAVRRVFGDAVIASPWWLISVLSGVGRPWWPVGRLHGLNCQGVLSLAADDIVPSPAFQTEEGLRRVERSYRLFGERHAENVVAFLRNIPPSGPDRLVVHCEGGISRSSAVARFAAEWRFGLDPDVDPGIKSVDGMLFQPNPIVANRLRAEVGIPLISFAQTEILERTLKQRT